MDVYKHMVAVHDIVNKRFIYIDIDKILAIEVKPKINIDGVDKQAKCTIIMDTANEYTNHIIIDEYADELFKRIAIGTGCIKLKLNTISEMTTAPDSVN